MAAALVAVKQHHATVRSPLIAEISDAMPADGADIVKAGILGRLTRRSENVFWVSSKSSACTA